MPSGRAIIHIVGVQIAIQLIWDWASRMFEIAWIREVGFLVLFVVGLFVVAWYLPKLSPILGGPSRKAERIRDSETESLGEVFISMMNADSGKDGVRKCLIVQPKRVDFEHIRNKSGPYLLFQWLIYNMSVCTIKFAQSPTGHALYNGQELKDTPEFLPSGLKPTLKRTEAGFIELRQFLLPKVAEEILNTESNKSSEFDFHMVHLQIDIIWPPRVAGQTWNFPFTEKLTFKVPQDGKVAFL